MFLKLFDREGVRTNRSHLMHTIGCYPSVDANREDDRRQESDFQCYQSKLTAHLTICLLPRHWLC